MRQPTSREWLYLLVDFAATAYLVWLQSQSDGDAFEINVLWTWSKVCRGVARCVRRAGVAADRRIDTILDRRRTV